MNSGHLRTWLFAAVVMAVLGAAWWLSDEQLIAPGVGIGYGLGIVGSVMMLGLLLYPLRKSWKRMHQLGSMRSWFTVHMALGVIGPAMVVIHSNYALRSTNATVAMVTMLLVVASGLFGRYIYGQIHTEIAGPRENLTELLADIDLLREGLDSDFDRAPGIESELRAFEAEAQAYRASRLGGLRATLFYWPTARVRRERLKQEAAAVLSAKALREQWQPALLRRRIETEKAAVDTYFRTVQRATRLHFFGRLFRCWHLLHMPLFLLLIAVAVGHIVAVHLY